MMVRVDEPRQHDVVAGLDRPAASGDAAASGRHQLNNAVALQHDTAFGAVGQDGKRILDPDRPLVIAHSFTAASLPRIERRL